MGTVKSLYNTTPAIDITPSGLNGLANNGSVTTSVVNNTSYLALDFYVELTYVYGTAPTANNNITIELQASVDNNNFSDIQNPPCVVLLTADTNTHRTGFFVSALWGNNYAPPPYFRIRITNNGGQALASSGNFLKIVPIYGQVV